MWIKDPIVHHEITKFRNNFRTQDPVCEASNNSASTSDVITRHLDLRHQRQDSDRERAGVESRRLAVGRHRRQAKGRGLVPGLERKFNV